MASTASVVNRAEETPSILSDNKFSVNNFVLEESIGTGRFGRVMKGKEKMHGYEVAIKIIKKDELKKAELMRQTLHELFIHSDLDHPNIIKFLTTFHDNDNIYLVLDYAENGSLFQILQDQPNNRFEERIAAKYCRQTADAVLYVHSKRYLHGDIKPENILLDAEKNVKLSDFGLSWFYSSAKDRGYCGTFEYLPPELITGDFYDFSVDQWSIGVLIYELLSGKSPFYHKKKSAVEKKILSLDYKFPKIIKPEAQDLIKKLLVIDFVKRLPLDEVLSHPWFEKCLGRLP